MSTEIKAQSNISMTSVKAIKDAADQSAQLLAEMERYAEDAGTTLTGIYADAEAAKTNAERAQTSADEASGYATSAYNQLADIEKVVDVLEWTAQHGEYALTPDTEVQTDKYYFTRTGYGGGTYNGSMVTFETQAGNNISSVIADIEPIQSGSGTPSPTNVRPISGHTDVVVSRSGKNLCDTSLVYNGYINSSQRKIASNANARTLYLPCKPNTTYTVSKQAGQRFVVAESTEIPTNNVVVSNIVLDYTASSLTITTSALAKYLVAFVYLSTADTGVTADQMLATCQIELGSEATAYEPYQGTTYTTALGTTVYGGTLDVTTGVLTVTHGYADLGDLTWVADTTNKRFYTNSKSSEVKTPTGNAYPFNAISTAFKSVTFNQGHGDTTLDGVMYCSGSGFISVRWLAHESDTANAFKTAVTGIKICYELATPQTYQLTTQQITALQGVNNVWANSGDILVVVKDTYSYLLVNNPTGNPSAQGWYELTGVDQAITQYVSTHLALTDDGLWLQADGSNARIRISTEVGNEGLILYGTDGNQIAKYGSNTVIGNAQGFHIEMDGTELGFYQGTRKVAYVSNNQLYITQSVVLQQMDLGVTVNNGGLGQWSWKVHANGQTPSRNNLNLKWVG